MKMKFLCKLLLVIFFLFYLNHSVADSLPDGNELAKSIRNTTPVENISLNAKIEVTLKNRKRISTDLIIETKLLSDDEFLMTYSIKPNNDDNFWQVIRKVGESNKYKIKMKGEILAIGKEHQIGLEQSSFMLTDIGLEFLHWPFQKTVKKQRRKSRSCHVLESKTIEGKKGNYSRVVSWVDIKSGAILAADFFTTDGKLLKRFSVKGLTKKNGNWQVDELEMRNIRDGTRSRLLIKY